MAQITTKSILTAIRAQLLNSPVESLVSTRIYPGIAHQNARVPYVVYHVIFATPTLTHDGDASQTTIGIQFDIYSTTFATVADVTDAIRKELLGADFERAGIRFQFTGIDDEDSIFGREEEIANLHHMRIDARLIAAQAA